MNYILLAVLTFVARQTDWMGGSGVQGPVMNWGTQFWKSDSVTAATPGQVSLIATSVNYSNWIKHNVDSNSGINSAAQGLMPADIDNDGIVDLVAASKDSVFWYKNDGNYNFTKKAIGPALDYADWCPCTYPCDLNKDGKVDVLVATPEIGVGWFENKLPGAWVYHSIDNTMGYSQGIGGRCGKGRRP